MRVLTRGLAIMCCACASGGGSLPSTASSRARAEAPAVRATPLSPRERQRAVLRAHNQRRADHCASPLRWSDELAREAQRWADQLASRGCVLEHSRTRHGENLAAGTTGAFSPEDIVQMWYREIAQYRFGRGGFSMKTGHFTQLVWRSTREVGCGVAQCKGLDVWVCNYDPPGNVESMYKEQVLPVSCRK